MTTFLIVYIDDILIYSRTREDHKKHIQIVLDELRKNKIYAKQSIFFFMKDPVEYLGHIVSQNGMQVNSKKINVVTKWEAPSSVKQVQSFLGFCNYYRKFVK